MLALVLMLYFAEIWAAPEHRLSIIGGHNATKGEFPYIVTIQECAIECSQLCNGVIISKSWILTSGHCVDLFIEGIWKEVYAGVTNIDDPNKQNRSVERSFYHENFNKTYPRLFDIGLVKVTTPFEFNELVQPAKLPKQDTEVLLAPGNLAGWGKMEHRLFPNSLQAVEVPVIDFQDCVNEFTEHGVKMPDYNNSAICTGHMGEGKGACSLDYGGPLQQDILVVGIVSCFAQCSPTGGLTLYTKISSYISWIAEHIDEELTF
ncbi:plasma kallikrein-like [Diabrotica virgifera virgifera]|uniref:Peptidase S1 domain-containing protein n=1 Tax=Diabrotica virgifera virgifera TaxID=50390 RepID=A0ABM5K3H5_DIAVI|nr:plasma kallikrein-like [Diabrotica virgifera virgifera]